MDSPRASEVGRTLRDHLAATIGPGALAAAGGGREAPKERMFGTRSWLLANRWLSSITRMTVPAKSNLASCRCFNRLGAPVAQPLQWDPQRRLLVTEWLGSRTLADALQGAGQCHAVQPCNFRRLTHSLVRGSEALETAFQGIAARLPLRETGEQTPPPHRAARALWTVRLRRSCAFAAYDNHSIPQGWETALREAWSAVADAICAGRVTFGGRDCTPRNVLTDGCAVWFVDFAVIGLDWPEARLTQYAAAVGAREPSVPLQSLLTHGDERWYVESGCIGKRAVGYASRGTLEARWCDCS